MMIANSALFGAQRDRVASRIPSRPYRRRSRVAGNSKPLHIWAGTGAYLENVGLALHGAEGHCHAASGLRSRWRFCSQGDVASGLSFGFGFGAGAGLVFRAGSFSSAWSSRSAMRRSAIVASSSDLAISTKESADFTAIVSSEVTWPGGNIEIYVLPNPIIRRMTFSETMDTLDNVRKSSPMSSGLLLRQWPTNKSPPRKWSAALFLFKPCT